MYIIQRFERSVAVERFETSGTGIGIKSVERLERLERLRPMGVILGPAKAEGVE